MSPVAAGLLGFVLGAIVGFLGCCWLVATDGDPAP